MCAIVGAVSQRNIVPFLLQGLERLEYRGYDSAGVAVVNGSTRRVSSPGRVARLAQLVRDRRLNGQTGIAHTRWATRGSAYDAEPCGSGNVSVVQHGTIANAARIRMRMQGLGYRFASDSEAELVANLVHWHLSTHCPLFEAVRRSMNELRGTYALGVISDVQPDRMVVARTAAPLVLGLGEDENFAASDPCALQPAARRVVYLEEGDCAEVGADWIRIHDQRGHCANRLVHVPRARPSAELGRYRHYMQKEVFEQPVALADTLRLCDDGLSARLFGTQAQDRLTRVRRVQLIACGSSHHAALVARYWIESIARVACCVDTAGEYRYRRPMHAPGTLVVAVSQSGETADTLAALAHARSMPGIESLAICNVPESELVRACDLSFVTRAGPEIGVASTKTFTTQLAALALLALALAKLQGRLAPEREARALRALRALPEALEAALAVEPQAREWGTRLAERHHALFLGRGAHYPIAMEGALKLKELSYIHAEAYAAGELKHGPLALVDAQMPVVALAPDDALCAKLRSNLQEVRARGGELYVIADSSAHLPEQPEMRVIRVPCQDRLLSPILHTVPLQLLAYHAALARGSDVDKPRNLAKSVSVE